MAHHNSTCFDETSRCFAKQVELFRRNKWSCDGFVETRFVTLVSTCDETSFELCHTSLNLWRNKFRVETSFVTLVSTCDETSFVTLVSLVFDIYVYIYMYIYIYIYMRYLCHHNSKRLYDETSLISVWYICIYIYVYIHTYMHKILLSSQLEGPLWRSFITLISLEFDQSWDGAVLGSDTFGVTVEGMAVRWAHMCESESKCGCGCDCAQWLCTVWVWVRDSRGEEEGVWLCMWVGVGVNVSAWQ